MQGSGFFSKTSIAVSLCKQDLTRCPFSRMGGQRKKKKERDGETRYLGKAALQCKNGCFTHTKQLEKKEQLDMQDLRQFASFNQ